jgi:hypothetical protein
MSVSSAVESVMQNILVSETVRNNTDTDVNWEMRLMSRLYFDMWVYITANLPAMET